MRFERVRIRAFGPLEEVDTGPDGLPSLVAVHAPNEGGKSTFFVALSSLLYGFYPAARARHPYAPWSGEDADAEADVALSEGRTVTVRRRLLASPWGRIVEDGVEEDLANRTVPWASHVRRELFDEVFALTLADLARVDDDRWPEIQDRLLGSMGAEDVRSTREVVEELEEEAKGYWRPDNRGTPRAAELQERLVELNEARREARRRDREARETARNLAALEERLREVGEGRREARALLMRVRKLAPVRRQLRRLEGARERAGDPADLEGLPVEPGERLDELRAAEERLRQRTEEREEEVERLRRRADALDDDDRALLERGAEIRELGKLAGEAGASRSRLEALAERRHAVVRRLRDFAGEILGSPWDAVDEETVRGTPPGELRTRIARYREAREEAARVEERLRERRGADGDEAGDADPALHPRTPAAGGALLLAGAALALWGAGGGSDWALAGGILTAAVGGFLLLRHRDARRRARRRRRAVEELRAERDAARRRREDARAAVAEAAGDLPLAEARLQDPGPEVVHVLERLQGLIEELRQLRSEAERHRERLDDVEARAERVVSEVELAAPDELVARIVALERALDAAEERRDEARSAGAALEQGERSLERLRSELEAARDERGALERRLAELGGGDPERGAEEARERLRARDEARVLERELVDEHPDLDELRERIRRAEEAGEAWTVDEEAVVAAEDRAEALAEEEKELLQEKKDLEHGLERLQEERTLDRVEGEILSVEEELDEVRRRRDRLALMARVLRAADRRFRERNQPDLLRAAGDHLSAITDGRYRRLQMPEDELDGTLLLQGPGYPGAVRLDEDTPVSTGTREQVYLALRLAIVDHLDAGGERLPLFLDEAFVNWDAERRERGFELVAELAEKRQIFVFTCHEPMARSLEARGARLLRLAGAGG